jgi:CubicO group peptidase (beta-lactamase class C family)
MVSAILLLLVVALPAAAQPGSPVTVLPAEVDRIMNQTTERWHVPGAAIAIVQNDKIVYLKAYGVKEVGKSDPVTPETLFHIGSTTKAFTAAAMAMLVDEGKMDWDDPVRKHLPWFHLSDPCADSLVTLRDIVSHRTGLSRHDEMWDNSPWDRETIVRRVGLVTLSKPFRSAYQYQNIMFIAAGEAVAAVAGMPWENLVQKRILDPLGMAETKMTIAGWSAADHATGHRWDREHERAVVQPLVDDANVGPAGEIKSSARDMAQWLRFQLGRGTFNGQKLVSSNVLEETWKPNTIIRVEGATKAPNPYTILQAYAMGWIVEDWRGERVVSHGGALNGFRAQVAMLPERNSGFAILENVGRGYALLAARGALIDLLTGHTPDRDWQTSLMAAEKAEDDKNEAQKKERASKRHFDTHPSRELAAYAGAYVDAAYGTATVELDRDQLVLRWNQLTVPLAHFQFDTFAAKSEPDGLDEQVQFTLGPDGEVANLELFGEEFAKKKPAAAGK